MNEYRGTPDQIERDFQNCCSEHEKCSEDLMKIANAIQALHKLHPHQYVSRIEDMEDSLKAKCAQIKKQRALIQKLLFKADVETKDFGCQNTADYKNSETQVFVQTSNFGQ